MPSIQVLGYNDKYVTVKLPNGISVNYNNIFLRDACSAPGKSVDANSKQKLFSTAKIDPKIAPKELPRCVEAPDGKHGLEVTWKDSHTSFYPLEFLERYSHVESRASEKVTSSDAQLWDVELFNSVREQGLLDFEYKDYANDDETLFKALEAIKKYGLIFINNVPPQTENTNNWFVEDIAHRIGYIKQTFYGKLFDVKSIAGAKNIADTEKFLPLHMDLLYYESPPGLQLLHTIKKAKKGGEQRFADSFLAASEVAQSHPQCYYALTNVPVPYHYENDNQHYYHSRPVVVEDESVTDFGTGQLSIKEVNYSPPFQAPFEFGITHPLTGEELQRQPNARRNSEAIVHNASNAKEAGDSYLFKDFLRGFRMFEHSLEKPENELVVQQPENTCVIFDNRRIVHGRNQFSLEGDDERWLKGCYLDKDAYLSRLRVLRAKK